MGKMVNGIHGPIQGAVGTIVGVLRNGKFYVRARATKRRLKSKKEKKNRNKMTAVNAFLRPIQTFLKEGFRAYHTNSHTYNAAKSVNLLGAFETISEEEKIFRPALVQVSHGDLGLASNIQVTRNGYDLVFTWDTTVNAHDNKFTTDQVMLLAYDPRQHTRKYTVAGQFRTAGTDTLNLDHRKGFTYHVYVAFTSANREMQSNSVYLGAVKV
jgi:hypothetical protein